MNRWLSELAEAWRDLLDNFLSWFAWGLGLLTAFIVLLIFTPCVLVAYVAVKTWWLILQVKLRLTHGGN